MLINNLLNQFQSALQSFHLYSQHWNMITIREEQIRFILNYCELTPVYVFFYQFKKHFVSHQRRNTHISCSLIFFFLPPKQKQHQKFTLDPFFFLFFLFLTLGVQHPFTESLNINSPSITNSLNLIYLILYNQNLTIPIRK